MLRGLGYERSFLGGPVGIALLRAFTHDTGIAQLVELKANGKWNIIAGDEDIAPRIEKLLLQTEAFALIKRMVKSEIKNGGGAKKKLTSWPNSMRATSSIIPRLCKMD